MMSSPGGVLYGKIDESKVISDPLFSIIGVLWWRVLAWEIPAVCVHTVGMYLVCTAGLSCVVQLVPVFLQARRIDQHSRKHCHHREIIKIMSFRGELGRHDTFVRCFVFCRVIHTAFIPTSRAFCLPFRTARVSYPKKTGYRLQH